MRHLRYTAFLAVLILVSGCSPEPELADINTVRYVDIIMDGSGNGTMITIDGFSRGLEMAFNVRAIHYDAADGWVGDWRFTDYPLSIFHEPEAPHVAMDASGTSLVVWTYDGEVYASQRDGRGSWSEPTLLGSSSGLSSFPRIAMDGSGAGIAIWSDRGVVVRRFVPDLGWEEEVRLDDGVVDGVVGTVNIAMQAGATAMAVWENRLEVYAAHYDPLSGWSPVERIDDSPSYSERPRMATSIDGVNTAALVMWEDSSDIVTKWFLPDSGWQESEAIGRRSLGEVPAVAVDASNRAMVVWSSDIVNVNVRRYLPETGWEAPVVLTPNGRGARIAMDSAGNAIAVWRAAHEDDSSAIYARRYRVDHGWGDAFRIGEAGVDHRTPRIAMDDSGGAIAVWLYSAGGRSWYDTYIFGTPFADFTVSPEPAIVGSPVVFDASGSYDENGVITLHAWDVLSNGVIDISTPDPITSFTFASAGTYSVGRRVTSDTGMQAETHKSIQVNPAGALPVCSQFTLEPIAVIAQPGVETPVEFTIAPVDGFSDEVQLSLESGTIPPEELLTEYAFVPNPTLPPSSTLSFTLATGYTAGSSHEVIVRADSANSTCTTTLTVTVSGYAVSVTGLEPSYAPGASVTLTLEIERTAFLPLLMFELDRFLAGNPDHLTNVSFTPNPVAGDSTTMSFDISIDARGDYVPVVSVARAYADTEDTVEVAFEIAVEE